MVDAGAVVGRFVEGFGGGIGIVAVYVVLGRAFDDVLRPKAFALLSSAWVLPSIVGPFVAGALAQHVSWRAVFWLVIPFVIPPMVLLVPRLGRLGGGSDHRLDEGDVADRSYARRRVRLAVVAAAGLALLQEAGTRLGRAGLVLVLAGAALLVPSLRRLLPAGAWRFRRGLPSVVMLRGVMAGAFFAGETFVPLGLQTLRGLDPAHAGLILTAGALGWAGGSFLQGRMHLRWGPVRLMRLGSSWCVVGLATLPLCLRGVAAAVRRRAVLDRGRRAAWACASARWATRPCRCPSRRTRGRTRRRCRSATRSARCCSSAWPARSTPRHWPPARWAPATFTVIWLTMAVVMVVAVATSGRVVPGPARSFVAAGA